MSTRNKLVLPKKLEQNIRKQQEDNLAGVINRYIEEIKFEETKTKSFIFHFSIVCKQYILKNRDKINKKKKIYALILYFKSLSNLQQKIKDNIKKE